MGHVRQVARGAGVPVQARRRGPHVRVAGLLREVPRPGQHQQRFRVGHEGGPGPLRQRAELHGQRVDGGLRDRPDPEQRRPDPDPAVDLDPRHGGSVVGPDDAAVAVQHGDAGLRAALLYRFGGEHLLPWHAVPYWFVVSQRRASEEIVHLPSQRCYCDHVFWVSDGGRV